MYSDKNLEKLFALIPQTKALNIVRDPIGSLKNLVNYPCRRDADKTQVLDFSCNPDEICENLIGYVACDEQTGLSKKYEDFPSYPQLNAIRPRLFNEWEKACTYHDTELRECLVNLKDNSITCIDMSEIVGEKAFETMNTLAKEFDFPPPNPQDKERFEAYISAYEGLLPLTFSLCTCGLDMKIYCTDKVWSTDTRIYIDQGMTCSRENFHTEAFEKYQDITQFLYGQESFYERIILCMDKKDFEIFKNHQQACDEARAYFSRFIPRLEQQKEIEAQKRKTITERDILSYLKAHKDLCVKAKDVFDEHLKFLRFVRPDIIESWSYYQEFLSICKEQECT
ncbi:DUF2972 domain-containing protein [Helicobacter sp. MIT 05-5293]|uniref:DUF2972 domain-containing protein n=1 Tax=Helicobacter sp. MIT 05-5293 TaxID=1548149 RepID=UPI000691003C|nr:DUF2972 domain-containing protein [Helicobacter sp. MIT 05-5293]